MRSYRIVALERGVDVVVPPIVVTQTIRGAPQDALINRLLKSKGVSVPPAGEELARAGGRLLARSGLWNAADAQVVAEAARHCADERRRWPAAPVRGAVRRADHGGVTKQGLPNPRLLGIWLFHRVLARHSGQ